MAGERETLGLLIYGARVRMDDDEVVLELELGDRGEVDWREFARARCGDFATMGVGDFVVRDP